MYRRPLPPDGALHPLPPFDRVVDELTRHFPEVWIVGGALRDQALGKPSTDFDIAVDGDPVEVVSQIARRDGLGYVVLDPVRRIVRLAAKESRLTLDVAPLVGGSIEADLAQRDFTINAVAYGVTNGAVVDPHGGLVHCRNRRLQMISPTGFVDDPARLARLYRFVATDQMIPDDEARRLVREQGGLIDNVAPERVWQELARLFSSPVSSAVAMMAEDRFLHRLFPELAQGRGMTQNRWHHLDVFDHSLETLRCLEAIIADPTPLGLDGAALRERLNEPVTVGVSRGAALRLAALLHDIGKPVCRSIVDGVTRFIGHDATGAELVAKRLARLSAPNKLIEGVARLVRHHLRPLNGLHDGALTPRAAYRYRRDLGDWVVEGVMLAWADAMATVGPAVTVERRKVEREALVNLVQAHESAPPLPRLLDGDDVMALTGRGPGKGVGAILEALEEAVGAGEVATRDEAIAFVKGWRSDS